ncbi:ABC-F family ATP-binding cassette domain-containing protein [soil metagenome]
MLLMSVTDVARGYDATPLFEGVSFELHAGDRIGLVGPNGAGKTTLLKVLAGIDEPEGGAVKLHAGARLGLLMQMEEFPAGRTVFQEAKSAFDELLKAQKEFEEVADELSHAHDDVTRKQLEARFDRLNELLRTQDAYQLDHKVAEVLGGLGFLDSDFDREIITFSGGQQRRLLLAKLLLAAPDVMLLDEPSNHLDIATTRWLEDYLARQPQGMIVVSHDRYFLDKVANRVLELHNRRITNFVGNYTHYVRQRDEKFERELKEFEAQQVFVEKQEEYIRKNHYGQQAKQAQSRVKVLDKIDRLEKPTKISGPSIQFGEIIRSGDIVFRADDLRKSYGDLLLFKDLSFDIVRGKRVGILGPNGAGKTTLLRILLGQEEPTSGKVKCGQLVQIGYLDQHLNLLDDNKTVIRSIWPEDDASLTEQKMRDLLGKFGLQGEIVEQTVASLSGGERSRAALARLTVEGANVLVLDEPTNHLDLWACDSLEDALKNFDGTVLVVSHDRYFLNRVVDMLIIIEPGHAEVVFGNYELYLSLAASRAAATKPTPVVKETKKVVEVVAEPERKKRRFPYRLSDDIEKDIHLLEAKIVELEAALQDVEIYKDAAKLKKTMAELDTAKLKLPGLYDHWDEALELNG